VKTDDKQAVSCNTTANHGNQWFIAEHVSTTPDPVKRKEGSIFWGGGCLSAPLPLNISCTVQVWSLVVQGLLSTISPIVSTFGPPPRSIFDPALQQNGLSMLSFSFLYDLSRALGPKFLTIGNPANDSWTIDLFTLPLTAVNPIEKPIVFLPNGSVDITQTSVDDLAYAQNILSSAETALLNITNVTVNALELVNWIYVSIFWTMLYDFGQVYPTVFSVDSDFTVTPYPSTNNIFINETLFNIYYSYLNTTVAPILGINQSDPNSAAPLFESPSTTNVLRETHNTTFIMGYSCNKRQFKTWLSALVAIILADYALIGVPYKIASFFAVAIQKRFRPNCEHLKLYVADIRESLRRMY
jgi:hypothetical protein